eukprot:INCI5147.4.p2 GENE.INCI5147.4~~INCI5147.4.p2  ORF type:complete len:116 (-),score=8.64 INCI5147.4:247-594(-)
MNSNSLLVPVSELHEFRSRKTDCQKTLAEVPLREGSARLRRFWLQRAAVLGEAYRVFLPARTKNNLDARGGVGMAWVLRIICVACGQQEWSTNNVEGSSSNFLLSRGEKQLGACR